MKKEQLLTLIELGLLETVMSELSNYTQDVILINSKYKVNMQQFCWGYISDEEFIEKINQIKLALKELVNQPFK